MRGDTHGGCGGRAGETHRERSRQGAPVRPTGAFYHTDLYPLLRRINHYLMRWVRKKYRIRTFKKFHRRWKRVTKAWPLFFAHWKGCVFSTGMNIS